jgi:hypothetical protein
VDHQVEHHVDVERAGGELTDAVNLEVDGVGDVRAERGERRVEAFEVADHECGPPAAGGRDHLVGLGERARDRLLHQHVDARFEQGDRDLGMRLGWHGEADGLDSSDERAPVGRELDAALVGDRAGRRLVRVAGGDERAAPFCGERGVDARVVFAE